MARSWGVHPACVDGVKLHEPVHSTTRHPGNFSPTERSATRILRGMKNTNIGVEAAGDNRAHTGAERGEPVGEPVGFSEACGWAESGSIHGASSSTVRHDHRARTG